MKRINERSFTALILIADAFPLLCIRGSISLLTVLGVLTGMAAQTVIALPLAGLYSSGGTIRSGGRLVQTVYLLIATVWGALLFDMLWRTSGAVYIPHEGSGEYGKLLIAGCIGAVCLYIAVSGLSGLARAGAVTAVIGGALLLELVICGVMQGDMQRITELRSTGGLAEEIYRGIALGGGSGCLPVLLGSVRGAPLRSLLRTFMSRALFAVIFLLSAELLAAPVMAISDFPAVMAAQLSQPFPSQRIDALFMIVFSCIAVYSIAVQTVTAALIAGELIPSCKRYAPAVILLLMTAGAVILEHSGSTSPVIAGMNIIALILLPAAHIIRTKMRIENA